ncbi:YppG family protein [Virgibacillus sp. W0430]|uniref:YppG family protein n=1 Tax=Virgibacillus sp. W0430 TaxID=3391580 RepID=UPI003F448FE2
MYRYPYEHSMYPYSIAKQLPHDPAFVPHAHMESHNAYPYSMESHYPFYQTPFDYYAKPKQPAQWPEQFNPSAGYSSYQKEQASINRPNGFTNPFQNESGQLDVNKVMATVSQFANTVQQISPVIKQFNDLMKSFK